MTKEQENKLFELWENVYHEHSEVMKLIAEIARKYDDLDDAFDKLQDFSRKLNNFDLSLLPKIRTPRIRLVWMKED